jgi:hypothetical protein
MRPTSLSLQLPPEGEDTMFDQNTSTQANEVTKQNQDIHFPLGDVYMTPGAMEAWEDSNLGKPVLGCVAIWHYKRVFVVTSG